MKKIIHLTLTTLVTILLFNSCSKNISNSQPSNPILKSLLQEPLISAMIHEVKTI